MYNPAVFSTLALRTGKDEYFLCWRLDDCRGAGSGEPSALPFHDQTTALYFLRSVISDSGQMHDLRLWLQEENDSFAMYAIDDHALMERTASMLASGQLAAATMEEGEAGGETEGTFRGDSSGESAGGGAASSSQAAAEATPLQHETARRESAVSEMEEIVLGPEKTEAPLVLAATVDSDQPPDLAAAAAVEAHPKPDTGVESEQAPALESQADVEEPPALAAEAEVETPETVDTEVEPDKPPALATDAEVDNPLVMAAEAEVEAPHALTADVDIVEAPALGAEVQHDDPPARRPSGGKDKPK